MSSMHSGAMLLVSFCYSSIDQLVFDGFPNALSTNLSVVIFIIFIANINHHWNIGRSMRNKNINIQKSYHKPLNIRYTTSHACSDFLRHISLASALCLSPIPSQESAFNRKVQ